MNYKEAAELEAAYQADNARLKSTIPHDAELRKSLPIASGCLDYFPDALIAVAEVSRVGNDQHNPGQPLHWAKEKSRDEADALLRHLVDRGKRDTDGIRHSAKVAWRALALLQREIEREQGYDYDPVLDKWCQKPSMQGTRLIRDHQPYCETPVRCTIQHISGSDFKDTIHCQCGGSM